MYNLLPLLIILICFLIILTIIIRKFPALAILDVANMPAEKEEKIKEQMIKNRLHRDVAKVSGRFWDVWHWLGERLGGLRVWIKKLKQIKAKYQQDKKLSKISKREKIAVLLKEAKELNEKEDWEDLAQAEKKLIDVISLDDKQAEAFLELGEVYFKLKKYSEAKQTFIYTLRLLELKDDPNQEAEVNYQLAQVNENLSDLDESLSNIIESLKVAPNNPRYLDLMLNIALKKKDKNLAEEVYGRIKESNPDNQNLDEWQEQIDNLPL